jgi:hypothetical protein
MVRHSKSFTCNEPGCNRKDVGFGTKNDLNRHKRSKHKISVATTQSYMCAAQSCADKKKIWLRLDNFGQHIDRMHKDEDKTDLIKRYVSLG